MKYAVVTGGTKGIGKQICIDLLKRDYFVITNYANDEISAINSKTDFLNYSTNFQIVRFDQSNDIQIDAFIHYIKDQTNNVDIIVCNTGITLRNSLDNIQNDDWEKVFKVNVHSHFYLIRDLNTIIQRKARIIFIGSLMGQLPHSSSIAYGVTKAAVHALSRNLIKEFSEREVTINTIAPGFVETEWQKDKPEEIRNNIYKKTAVRRFATVQEISQVLMMIIDNDFINGETITVDGGYNYQ